MTSFHQRNHPLRDVLDKELQQRTFPALSAPCYLCQFVLMVTTEDRAHELDILNSMLPPQQPPLTDKDIDINLLLADTQLRWEKHSEFSSYTFIYHGTPTPLFSNPHQLPGAANVLDHVPGQIFRIMQLTILAEPTAEACHDTAQLFHQDTCINSLLADKQARIWSDFKKHTEGSGRMLLLNYGLSPSALGRLTQQLFDVGNYRKLSLLGWPVSRQALSKLTLLEQQLSDITQRIEQERDNDESLLNEITQMAAETEHLIASTSSRLQATSAYYQLTLDRIKSLAETPVEGMLSLQDFSERRLTPAFRTSESVVFRQTSLSNRLGRSTELLRTRISLKLEQQNQHLLASMNKRARQQLNMQQVVEGLSLVAISYYAVQLTEKSINALSYWLPGLNVHFWQSISIPIVVVSVAILLFWIRRKWQHHD